jgi:hypothetical protein
VDSAIDRYLTFTKAVLCDAELEFSDISKGGLMCDQDDLSIHAFGIHA